MRVYSGLMKHNGLLAKDIISGTIRRTNEVREETK